MTHRSASRLVLGLILIVTAILLTLQTAKWRSFGYNGLDLAIYTNTVHNLANGRGFVSSIHDPSYLGDHLELGLLPVAAIYKLWPSGLTLLFIQTLVITGTAWLVWLTMKSLLGWRGGLAAAALWLVHPFTINVALYEFHGLVFAWPLLWWSIAAYRDHHRWQWWLTLGLLCLVREDMPLVVLGWALLAAVERRGWRWWAPAAIAGLGWFIVAQHIIAAASPDQAYKYLAFYRWAGNTPLEILTVPFRHPVIFLSHIFQANNWQTVLGLLLAVGGLAVWRWRLLLPITFILAQLLMLGTQAESLLRLHYVIPYLPFLAWAAAEAWRDVRGRRRWVKLDPMIATALATVVLVVGPLYAHLLYGPFELPWRPRPDTGTSPTSILQAAAAEVRPTDRVLTTFNFLPALANRSTIYSLNYLYLGRRQYTEKRYTIPTDVDVAVIDWQQLYQYQFLYRTTLFEDRTGAQRIRDFLLDQNLALVWWADGVAVYRRDRTDDFVPTRRITIGQVAGDAYGPMTLLTLPTVNAAVRQTIGRESFTTIPVELRWLRQIESELPLSLRFSFVQDNRVAWTSTRLLGQGFYPAVDWPVGSAWATRYFLSIPAAIQGAGELRAEVVELDGRYRLDWQRKFSPVVRSATSYGTISLGQLTLPPNNQ